MGYFVEVIVKLKAVCMLYSKLLMNVMKFLNMGMGIRKYSFSIWLIDLKNKIYE